jgi:hypothetical protein
MLRAPIATEGRTFRPGDITRQCSFCLNEVANLDLLVTASSVSVCSACVECCVAELRRRRIGEWRRWWDPRGPLLADPARRDVYRSADATCSFCGADRPRDTLVAEHARICSPCVRLALDVILERQEIVVVS